MTPLREVTDEGNRVERERVDAFVTGWLQQYKDMPLGNRSMLFRDPDGNPIKLFKPVAKA